VAQSDPVRGSVAHDLPPARRGGAAPSFRTFCSLPVPFPKRIRELGAAIAAWCRTAVVGEWLKSWARAMSSSSWTRVWMSGQPGTGTTGAAAVGNRRSAFGHATMFDSTTLLTRFKPSGTLAVRVAQPDKH